MLDYEGSFSLVKNGPTVTVWRLSPTHIISLEEDGRSISSSDAKWSKHSKDKSLLLAVSLWQVHVYRWSDLFEVFILELQGMPAVLPSQSSRAPGYVSKPFKAAEVGCVFFNASGSHMLIDIIQATNTGQDHIISILQTSELGISSKKSGTELAHISIPPHIQQQIEIPLGLLLKQRIIFLDIDYWMCSWRVSANNATEKVQKHYSVPRDWLNIECLKCCALLADGRFIIPNSGELAVVRSIAVSHR